MFEVNIRYIGGLLSAFYLTGDEVSWPLEAPGSSWLKRAWENTNPTPSFYEKTGFRGSTSHLHRATYRFFLLFCPAHPLCCSEVAPKWW